MDKKIVVEGKSKKIYEIDENTYFMCFKPHLRSITSKREENIKGTDKERLISNMYFMNLLERNGIKTQIKSNKIEEIDGEQGILVEKVRTIPIEFICRYYAAGSIVRLYPSLVKEGQKFKTPLYKFDLKQDIKVAGVDDPTLNENYIIGLELLTKEQFEKAKTILAKVGEIIRKDLERKSIKLIDMKMEMGFAQNGDIIVIDEISQDCIRANDMQTGKSLTKDAFRQLKSDEEVLECYKEFNRRLRNLEDIYEYIRDNNSITKEMSNTKRIIQELIKKEQSAIDFCNKKIEEEKQEIEEAKVGKHFHDDMTKRKILVNEISQYIYWKTIVAVSNYKYFNIEKEIVKILKDIDITKIGEKEPITVEEIIQHEIEKMKEKEYLKEVI